MVRRGPEGVDAVQASPPPCTKMQATGCSTKRSLDRATPTAPYGHEIPLDHTVGFQIPTVSMSLPRRRVPISRAASKDLTRRKLLDAARRVFLRQGFHATTVDMVALEAGFTK